MRIIIYGDPKAKQSAKFAKIGKFINSYQPKSVVQNEKNIRAQVLEQLPEDFRPFTENVIVTKLHFVFSPLKGFSKKKIKLIEDGVIVYKNTKPDLTDNLSKSLFDAMEGIVYDNDSRIVAMDNLKKYYGFRPRIELDISEFPI